MRAKNSLRWVIGALAGFLTAAPAFAGDPVMSLQPLHPGREAVLEPAFEGEWVYSSVSLKLRISRASNFLSGKPEDYYDLVLEGTENDETLRFEAHLVRLGSTLFADIRQSQETGLITLNPHAFARIRVDSEALHFDFLEEGFVEKALETGRTDLAHSDLNGTLVLTAPARQLQDFVQSVAFDDDAFDETVDFTRLKEASASPQP